MLKVLRDFALLKGYMYVVRDSMDIDIIGSTITIAFFGVNETSMPAKEDKKKKQSCSMVRMTISISPLSLINSCIRINKV